MFVDFGALDDASDAETLLAELEARRSSQAAATSASAPAAAAGAAPLFNLSQATRRSKRKAQIPLEFLPKVGCCWLLLLAAVPAAVVLAVVAVVV
jgi:hypothetical protein